MPNGHIFALQALFFKHLLVAQDLHNFFGNFKDIEIRLMGVVIFLRMGKKCIIKQLTSVQPPLCNIVTYSVLTEQLRKFVPQERLFTCYTWLISYSRSRPIRFSQGLFTKYIGLNTKCIAVPI